MLFKDNYRWIILTLLFIATTILYIDRAALGIHIDDFHQTGPDIVRRGCQRQRECRP